jgi:hypothetical protein
MAWILTTFFLPFFATYARDKSIPQVSLQITSVMLVFGLTTQFGSWFIEKIKYPHAVNIISLCLITSGCFVMSMQQTKENYFFDATVGGYLLIGTGTGFITGISFQEIFVGTENFIAKSRWRPILM